MPPSYTRTVNSDQATFIGFGLEGVGYGVNVVLFGIATHVLLHRSRGKRLSNLPIFAFTCFMFALCTVHYALNFNNVYDGTMVHVRPHISAETHLLVGADTIWLLTDFFSQLLLIYRCYLVWGKSIWVVILPLLIALASMACGLAVTGLLISINPTAPQVPAALVPIGDADFALSLIVNFMVSSLIVGRIWWMTRESSISHSSTSIQKAMGIVIESGLLFLAIQFVFVILFAIAHPAQAVVEPIATQIYVTSPMLIIVRVGMGAAYEPTSQMGVTGTSMHFAHTRITQITSQSLELHAYKVESSKDTLAEPV
ncbi:hypothetical protein DFH08DRAFT_871631 [Mycena albidolilacea]|uniref:Uncharacterized protein n=1 Tax=Mycena albidolilacea TaxID=1033008 RepID=A0AAD6ZYC7_9AGAR|nr:hypothetical protein DFH08DRAFT_871631 [Mycena albidolilacea]